MTGRSVMALPIATIGEGPHLGLIDQAAVVSLRARLAAEGQIVPILVKRNGDQDALPWTMIAGRHRLLAAQALGWTHIDAIQSAEEDDGREVVESIETAENLDRRVLRPIERAILLAARVEDHRRAPQDGEIITVIISSAERMAAAAASSGCSVPNLYRDLAIYRAIVQPFPELYRSLNDHPLGASFDAMRKLSRVTHDRVRRQVIEAVLADPDMASIDVAMVALGIATSKGKRPDISDQEARYVRGFSRLKLTDKRAVSLGIINSAPKSIGPEMVEAMRARGFID